MRARVRKERGGASPDASTADRRGDDEPAESAPDSAVERDAGTEVTKAEDQGGNIPPWSDLASSLEGIVMVLDAETFEVVAKSAAFDETSANELRDRIRAEAGPHSFDRLAKREVPILKVDEERVVYGIVLEPDGVDAQDDTISADEIYRAAHKFMEDYGNVGLQHQTFINGKARILQSYIAPVDFQLGDQPIKKGTWLMAMRVIDDDIWKAVKSGVITGFSIGGSAIRRPAA